MIKIGQNLIYTVHVQYFWQGNQQLHVHVWCIYTVLANPTYDAYQSQASRPKELH